MGPLNVQDLRHRTGELVEKIRYARSALVRDCAKQVFKTIPGGRSAWVGTLRHRMSTRHSPRGPLVLMYHRIAEHDPDPWALSVSPRHFAEQMEVLARQRRPIALSEFVSDGKVAAIPADAVAVTFDDGYADNLLIAKPILERLQIPATVFVTSVAVDHPRGLWWDELERMLLTPSKLPDRLRLGINGAELSPTAESNSPDSLSGRHTAFLNKTGQRWLIYEKIHSALLGLPYVEKIRVLDGLTLQMGHQHEGCSRRRLLTAKELRRLAEGQIVQIGCHTETHPLMANLSEADQQIEVRKNKDFLEALLGRSISSFAYPHGSYNAQTVVCLRRAGVTLACHTRPGLVRRNASPFELPRLHVHDWTGDEFLRVLAPVV